MYMYTPICFIQEIVYFRIEYKPILMCTFFDGRLNTNCLKAFMVYIIISVNFEFTTAIQGPGIHTHNNKGL